MKYLFPALALLTFTASFSQDLTDKLAEDVVAMAKIGSCYGPSFTADGKEIVFLSNISGLPQLWKMPATGGWPTQLTAFNDPVTGVATSPKGDWIAYELAPGGGLNAQVYLLKNDGTGRTLITKGGKSNNRLDGWSDDGKFIAFSSNTDNSDALDCFLYDVEKQTTALIARNQGIGSISDIDENNSKFLVSRLKSRGSNDLYLINTADKSEVLLTKHDGPATFFGSLGKNNTILLASNKDSDLVRFETLKDGVFKPVAARPSEELVDFIVNNSNTQAILVWSEAGKNKMSVYDLVKNAESKLPDFPVELVQGITYSPDDSQIAFTGSGSRETTNIWSYNFKTQKFSKLTDSPHAGVDFHSMIEPELVKFKSFDGLELNGWLYKPKTGTKPFPTVISYHGGPEGQSGPGFNITAQLMVRQGTAFFLPNVRGSSGSGKKYVNLDNGALRFNGVKDIKACYDYLVSSGTSKPNAIGIMGGSYGGYMVMAGVTEYPDMFAAGANLFGVVNFETFFAQTEPWMAAISTVEYGDPKTEADLLRKLSPIHNAKKIKTPLIVLHGANDTNVPVVEAEQVVAALKENNVPVKYVLFPDEGHGWRKTNNRVTSTVEIVQWFAKYLK